MRYLSEVTVKIVAVRLTRTPNAFLWLQPLIVYRGKATDWMRGRYLSSQETAFVNGCAIYLFTEGEIEALVLKSVSGRGKKVVP